MPRPKKWRKVCSLPDNAAFAPLNAGNIEEVKMSVEEYETIRLIDLEGLTQEECAERMSVARTTVQRIYIEARHKLADFLVNGSLLKIEGGFYELCELRDSRRGCGRCQKHGGKHKPE